MVYTQIFQSFKVYGRQILASKVDPRTERVRYSDVIKHKGTNPDGSNFL